jgi:FkbM family methyltransferase
VFLDCGAHNGCSVRKFIKTRGDWSDFEIICFECNPKIEFVPPREALYVKRYRKAVWITDAKARFYLGKQRGSHGSSLLRKKSTGQLDRKKPIWVDTIDFSLWLINNFAQSDYIVLKMDIEGAEYAVLDRMFSDRSIHYVNELFIEWHWNKIGHHEEKHKKLVNHLIGINICPKPWNALK